MRLLLDTHVAVWAVTGSPKLPASAAALIANPASDVAFGAVTLLEIAIKNATGRSNLGITAAQAAVEFDRAGFDQMTVALAHIVALERMPRLHGDPFDRLLVATAEAERRHLLTHDRALAAYGDHVLLV